MKNNKITFPISKWNLEDRPREKLMLQGKRALTNAELLAIIIGSGSVDESAVDLSKRILKDSFNNLNVLSKKEQSDFLAFKGIGQAKAISLIAALELGRRFKNENEIKIQKISSSNDAYTLLASKLEGLAHEEFWIIYVNNSNKVLEVKQLSVGGLTATMVDVRLVFKKALQLGAVAIIVAHNHPSGVLQPSKEDKQITNKLITAGKSLDIKVLDHLIITEKMYFSFADQGLI